MLGCILSVLVGFASLEKKFVGLVRKFEAFKASKPNFQDITQPLYLKKTRTPPGENSPTGKNDFIF